MAELAEDRERRHLEEMTNEQHRRLRASAEAKRRFRREAASTIKFEAIGAADSAARPRKQQDWLVERLLPVGRFTLLVAQAGVGKSTLMLHFANDLVRGKSFLGFDTIEDYERNVLYVNADMTEDEFDAFTRDIGGISNRVRVWHVPSGDFDVTNEEHMEQFADLCVRENIGVVIVDVWGSVYHGDENDNSETRHAVNELIAIISKLGLDGLVLIQHAGKSFESRGVARGASALEGAAGIIWRYTKNDDQTRWLEAGKRMRAVPKFQVLFDEDTWAISKGGASVPGSKAFEIWERRMQERQEKLVRILHFVANNPGANKRALREALGRRSDDDVAKLVSQEHIVVREATGNGGSASCHYITPKGTAFLAEAIGETEADAE